MTRIHVNRKGDNLGIFSSEEVALGLKSGKFLPTDLAWAQGMETWLPLSAFPDLPSVENEEIPSTSSPLSAMEKEIPPAAQAEPAWERRRTLGTFKALTQTIIQVLRTPQATFSRMQREGGLIPPLLCFLLIAIPVQVVGALYQMAVMNPLTLGNGEYQIPKVEQSWILVGTVILSPLLFTLMIFIWSGIIYGCLMVVGGANRGFETTYRTLCYTYTGTIVLGLIPLCGGIVMFFVQLYIQTIALRETHGCSTTQSLIATLLPLILCVGCAIALTASLVAMGISMGS